MQLYFRLFYHAPTGGADENNTRRDKNKARLCMIVEICYLCMRETMSPLDRTRCFLDFVSEEGPNI